MIRPLAPGGAGAYAEMTFSALRPALESEVCALYPGESDEREVRSCALAAEVAGRPAGLLLGGLPISDRGAAEVLSLFVLPQARRQGIAAELLAGFERRAEELGIDRVETVYLTGKPGSAAFERLIARAGWEPPLPRMLIYKCELPEAFRMPWFERYEPRTGIEIFPWRELPPGAAEALRRSQEADPWIAPDLEPWRFDEHGFEPASSVGMRLDGAVVGWVINHAVGTETVRFTCSFIRRDLQRRGRLVAAYSESIRRLAETDFCRCMFAVPMEKKEMARFVERRCAPWGGRLTESRGSGKALGPMPRR